MLRKEDMRESAWECAATLGLSENAVSEELVFDTYYVTYFLI